jgi:hypothetical protein
MGVRGDEISMRGKDNQPKATNLCSRVIIRLGGAYRVPPLLVKQGGVHSRKCSLSQR